MAAGAIEALAKVLEPLGLGCIETQETKTRRRRLTMLQCGRRYQRQKKTFGFSSGTEEVTVRVDEDATSLLWWASGADKKHIDLKDVATRGDLVEGLSELLRDTRKNVGGGENPETAPTKGKTVMERTKKQAYFVRCYNIVVAASCPVSSPPTPYPHHGPDRTEPSPTQNRIPTRTPNSELRPNPTCGLTPDPHDGHCVQMERDIELTQKRRAAEKRKEKFMKDSGGLKYTALAMAARD
mmetsp:Transcript_72920/g.207763  ORF Transcript_72920/g.207763 Transcript_72920/m.207763 type:complete len:239 (+) Transcript_72920:189-905(+)